MVHLYDYRDSITEALHRLPGWARPEPTTTNGAEERPKRLSSLTAVSPVIPETANSREIKKEDHAAEAGEWCWNKKQRKGEHSWKK
jgi:hypothetical protein